MPHQPPVPGQFEQDPRVSFDKTTQKWQYEDEGLEFEWNGKVWVSIVDEELLKAQQAAYSVPGVDESTPANAVLAREERRNLKRKKNEKDYTSNTLNKLAEPAKSASRGNSNGGESSKAAAPPPAQKKTGVWVTNLPPNTTVEKMANVFNKAGVLLIDDEGNPKIKMYYDNDGVFKGEALVTYFKEGSVDLAITLLDDTELELGAGYPAMRVGTAEYQKDTSGKEKGKEGGEKKEKKEGELQEKKLAWHSDDESDQEDSGPSGAPSQATNTRFLRVVVLKGMFVPEELDKDPGLLLELKEEVREEAETLGQVTSVQLYDKEEDGVMTIKFKDPISAQACINKMNNRYFDGRVIYAGLYNGKERFKKSGGRSYEDEDEDGEGEKGRLDNFAKWLVDGDEEEVKVK
ncbi:hypothetical protein I350_06464 [Cryptococcus amylolentus CBS 6273]|uniref:RRM domain-containing protein n=1 Tax=Cryptococcus amylolentus CBS 6273 TaxID=1296118 RepID=A0A1E3JLB3_9TREE|nr:hypothetical protein I350_06464 [Cryptococcus amylolentus CBS 6273]